MEHDDELKEIQNPNSIHLSPSNGRTAVSGEDLEAQEFDPFGTVWTSPRDTVRRIIAANPELHVDLLVCLAGIGQTLDRASMRNVGDDISVAAIIGVACVLGPFGGLLGLWVGSHMIRLSGTWIGGSGTRQHIKTAMAWASVPAVFALPLWVVQIWLFGSEMFTKETPLLDDQHMLWILFIATALLDIVLAVWAFVLLCNTIAEVQGFRSAWRGLGNIILAGVLISVPVFVIVVGLICLF